MNRLAQLISYLAHPLLFPTLSVAVILALNPWHYAHLSNRSKILWVIVTFILTFVFPVVWLLMLKSLHLVTSIKLESAKDRIIPYVATATFYLWAWKLFRPSVNNTQFSDLFISTMLLGAAINVMFCFFINLFFKISLHTAGMGGLIGLMLVMVNYSAFDIRLYVPLLLCIAGWVGSARLWLGAHRSSEVYSGYVVGFVAQFTAFFIIPLVFNL